MFELLKRYEAAEGLPRKHKFFDNKTHSLRLCSHKLRFIILCQLGMIL